LTWEAVIFDFALGAEIVQGKQVKTHFLEVGRCAHIDFNRASTSYTMNNKSSKNYSEFQAKQNN
jgi:hypothetical protein